LEEQPISHPRTQNAYQKIISKLSLQELDVRAYPFTTVVTCVLFLSLLMNILLWHGSNFSSRSGDTSVATIQRTYGKDTRYMSLNHDYDHLWNRIASEHGGLIKYPDPNSPHAARVEQLGVMSMFHQLHCIASFRNALQDAYYGHKVSFDQTENRHWPHCLDYMRQAIICAADDTIEREKVVNGTRTFKIDGMTDHRQCKDSTHIYELLREHGLPDAKGPLLDFEEYRSSLVD